MRPFVLGVWLLTPAAVFACSGSVCFYTPAVGDGALPANVSGIVFTTLGGPGPDFDATDAGFELFRDTGEQVANTLEVSASGTQIVLRPRDAFDAGASFVVRYPGECGRGPPKEATFSTTSARPMPASIGTLTVKAEGHGQISIPGGSACVEQVEAAYAQFGFVPDPALMPFLPVTQWALLVDGVLWAQEKPGAMHENGLLASLSQPATRVLEVDSPCPSQVRSGLALGTHQGQLQAFIAGSSVPLTATVQFSLACSGASDAPTPIEDAPHSALPKPSGCASAPGLMFALTALVFRRRADISRTAPPGSQSTTGP